MYQQKHGAFQRLYQQDKLTLGFVLPTERMAKYPIMENQLQLAQMIEHYGFAAMWLRDVTIQNLDIDDNGQMYDLWIYLTYLAAKTKQIALGTAGVVLPLRHPVRIAKEAASIDRLFPGRLIMGVASGDRELDFTALGVDRPQRGEIFRETYEFLDRLLKEDNPTIQSNLGDIDGSTMGLIPKPETAIPTMVTGFSQQSLEWIARHGDGWFQYPRSIEQQELLVKDYRELTERYEPGIFKPFSNSLFIDLSENPDERPQSIPLGYRLGRYHLLELLQRFQAIGVNHIAFVLYFSHRPPEDVIQELGEEILPHFPSHQIPVEA
ncbi:TIGR03571 family LLM class oxidoreductase [Paenibacillus abyssi]|uniref:Luciferase-like domain-containing protein n=1 Tax=Paenibacillus abyssi TaxID=1340531 RepID=A0A917FTF9_9BACL|nr:TIGR03571 family LLM class oxidoreductase [Paenibacillus abyssi]GGG03497.1 hypothetical protein GCM10010916_20760 [Paenibacillus abyssi]